jgi:hypothetical protein
LEGVGDACENCNSTREEVESGHSCHTAF